jgi:hypothetical protein
MEEKMNTHHLLSTPVASASVSNRRNGQMLAIATVVACAAAAGLAARSPGDIDGALELSFLPSAGLGHEADPQPLVDHASVDWDKVPIEPDPSPRSIAAYGD